MPLSWPRGACRRTWLQARAASRNLSVPLKPRAPVYVRTMMLKNAQKEQRRRGPGRQFEPGQSGNPAGRPRGARNRATVLAEKLMQDDIEERRVSHDQHLLFVLQVSGRWHDIGWHEGEQCL